MSQDLTLLSPESVALPDTFQAGLTVIRMIIGVTLRATGAGQIIFGNWGAYVADDTSSGTDTILDLLDYYLLRPWYHIQSDVNDGNQVLRENFDIRTMRKLRGRERRLRWTLTNNAASGGSVSFNVNVRFLLRAS